MYPGAEAVEYFKEKLTSYKTSKGAIQLPLDKPLPKAFEITKFNTFKRMRDNLPFWILTVAYAGHVLEEYVLDWRKWAQETSKLKLEWSEFFVANFAVIILGISCSVVGFDCPVFSYMFVGLAATNAMFAHIGATIIKKKFSPGLITSLLLFIPVSTWAYIIAEEKGILTWSFILITLGGGVLIMLFPVSLQLIKQRTNIIR